MSFRYIASLVLVLVVTSACSADEIRPSAASTLARSFTFAMSGDASALDPWNVLDDNSLLVTQQIFEPLVTYDAQTFDVRPNLAVSWQVSSDKRQWTLKLRDGVRFHDGTEFNSDAVVFNFERARRTDFPYRNRRPIADDYDYWRSLWGGFDQDSLITKVEAFDRLTVRFTTRTPFGPFLPTLAMATFGIVSPASIKADPDGWMLPTSNGAAGTGPFMFTPGSWVKDDEITLVRNPSYWRTDEHGARLPYLDTVRLRTLTDAGFRAAAVRGGQVDAIRDFDPADLPMLKTDRRVTLVDRRANNVGYLRFNTSHPPLNDPDVRKAIAMAIDQDHLVTSVLSGLGAPASQFLPPGMLGYDDAVRVFQPYDPEGARRLLIASSATPFELELWYMDIARPYFPAPRAVADAIAKDLAAVGITVVLRTIDFTSYRDRARNNQMQAWLLGWTGDNGDPDNFLCVFFCDTTSNGAWNDAFARQTVGYLHDAQAETDAARRAALYRQASRLIQKDVPAVPLVHTDMPVALGRYVSGYVPHPKGSEPFTYVQVLR